MRAPLNRQGTTREDPARDSAQQPTMPPAPHGRREADQSPRNLAPEPGQLLTAGNILITQQHLQELNFNPGPMDGVWHPATTTAIRTLNRGLALARAHNTDCTTLSQ
jgi:peptidoglycan hydrolase-like protein with peptidoglycan-binding domain